MSCLLGIVLNGPARADDTASAREHYERGTKFYDIGKYDDAIREFEAAYEAKSDPAIIYNLAQAHRLAGHNQEALQLYRNYLRYVPHPPNRADIDERIRVLEKAIAERSATGTSPQSASPPAQPAASTTPATGPAAAPPTGTTTGAPPPPAPPPPAPPPAAPETYGATGSTGSEGTPPGGPPLDAYGQPIPQPYPAGADYGVATQAAPPSPAPRSARRKAGIIVASIGGGFLLGGAISGLVTWSESKQLEKAAQNHDTFDPSVESSGRTAAVLQWVGYGVGAAAVGVGIILIATAPSSGDADSRRVAALPLVGPGLGGAQLRMSF
ncbi:MAG TPA: tetratricopeptide repeat protein [Polyangia bacterium]